MTQRTVVMLGGSSAGHLFPALCVSQKLLSVDEEIKIVFLGDNGHNEFNRCYSAQEILNSDRFNFREFSFGRVDSSDKLVYLSKMIKYIGNLGNVYSMIKNIDPIVTVGFGGYQSFLPVLCTKMLGKKTVIHEQNACFGLANRLLYPFTDIAALSFRTSADSTKKVFTGNPVRKFDKNLLSSEKDRHIGKLGLLPGLFTIVVVGGSSGAEFINNIALDVFGRLGGNDDVKDCIQVFHIAGKTHYESVKKEALKMGMHYVVKDFQEDMGAVFSSCDIIISRAGATTIAELSYFALPAILIPYPYAFFHQVKNAGFLEKMDACIMYQEKELDTAHLLSSIMSLYSDPLLRNRLSENISKLHIKSADENLAKLILELSN